MASTTTLEAYAEANSGQVNMGNEQQLQSHQLCLQQHTGEQSLTPRLSGPVLHHDPSFSGEFDPYIIIILSQL